MRKIAAIVIMMALLAAYSPVLAAEGGEKGASATAYEHASDEAIFHRVGDWFATIGKPEEEKNAMIAERKAKRAAVRARKELQKKDKELAKERVKVQKATQKETREMKGQIKGMKRSVGKQPKKGR
ncbi:MAG: hypothetical protein KKD29_03105 [Candidatus Omnitrophica bacterium]|nr:hypothetical protein [Candidatus Omnitrophota bacterium]MBU4488754.1 hypothetical protein [Candidatus Omnitrophota bacterium]MCG2705851.1 hypothetical protein [Candidatus Omnitrophota bacterium]